MTGDEYAFLRDIDGGIRLRDSLGLSGGLFGYDVGGFCRRLLNPLFAGGGDWDEY